MDITSLLFVELFVIIDLYRQTEIFQNQIIKDLGNAKQDTDEQHPFTTIK